MTFFDFAFLGESIKFFSSYVNNRNLILLLQIVGNISMVAFWTINKQYDLSIITSLAIFSTMHSKKTLNYYLLWLVPYAFSYVIFFTSFANIFLGLLPFLSRGGKSVSVIKSRFIMCYIYYIGFSYYYGYNSILFWSILNLSILILSFKKDKIKFSLIN